MSTKLKRYHTFPFSPFDALGISTESVGSITERDIRGNFKRLSFYRHPDKKPADDQRWPMQSHLASSRDFLIELFKDPNGLANAAQHFEDYPVCYQKTGSIDIYPWNPPDSLPGPFTSCPKCRMVLLKEDLGAHCDEHNICSECSCDPPPEGLESHYQAAHHIVRCDVCGKRVAIAGLHRHRDSHSCPLCLQPSLPNVWKHLEEYHWLQLCGDCGADKIESHIHASHPYKICQRCERKVFDLVQHDFSQHQCQSCKAWADNLNDHYKTKHSDNYCVVCGGWAANLADHLETEHPDNQCDVCGGWAANLDDHLETEHPDNQCDVCGGWAANLADHLETEHPDNQCDVCGGWAANLANHLETEHSCARCPACQIPYVINGLWSHLWGIHELQRCGSSCSGDMEHLANEHNWVGCKEDECLQILDSRSLNLHLRQIHHWTKCDFCEHTDSTKELVSEHTVWAHNLKECPQCEAVTAELQQHLQVEHGFQKCPLCEEWSPLEELRAHIEECLKMKPCPVCHKPQSSSSYSDHCINKHHWVSCVHCGGVQQDTQLLDSHIRNEHDPRPCPDCEILLPKSGIEKHQVEEHAYKKCPFCDAVSLNLLQHIFQTHDGPENRQQPRNAAQSTESARLDQITTKSLLSLASSLAALAEQGHIDGLQDAIAKVDQLVGQGQNSDRSRGPLLYRTASPECQAPPADGVVHTNGCDQPRPADVTGDDASWDNSQSLPANLKRKRPECPDSPPGRRSLRQRSGTEPVNYAIAPDRRSSRHRGGHSKQPPTGSSMATDVLVTKLTSMETTTAVLRLVFELQHDTTWKEAFQSVAADNEIAQLAKISARFETREHGSKLIKWFSLMLLADALDASKKSRGRERADKTDYSVALGSGEGKSNEHTTGPSKNQVQRARQVSKVCGRFKGALCFLVPNPMEQYLQLAQEGRAADLRRFHKGLERYEKHWEAGATILEGIRNGVFDGNVIEEQKVLELEDGASSDSIIKTLLGVRQRKVTG